MSKFEFKMSCVVEASNAEDALAEISTHISTVNRQQASGIDGVAAEFTIVKVGDEIEAVDLTDKHTQSHGPIELDLDPKSAAGVSLAAQKLAKKAETEAEARVKANEGKTDAEIMAEHSAKEQAALNAK